MVPQIPLPGVTYDATSESWGTKCIKKLHSNFLTKVTGNGFYPFCLELCSFLVKFQVCFVL